MKKIVVLIFIIVITSLSYSQSKISVGLGYDVALPAGDFADIAKTGYSWTLFGEYRISPQYSVQLLSSYMIFPVDIEPVAAQGKVITFDLKSIPIKGAVKYFLYDEFFLVGEIGANFIKVSADFQDSYGGTTNESTDYTAKFTLGAGLGTVFRLSDQAQINITAKYDFVDGGDSSIDFSHFLIGAGLVFHFNI
ncbi:MAG TPA: outer membrane beta-barrel protein [Ignavibacteriaceae bacterium]